MAIRLAKAEEAMRAERQLLKERVLQIDQLTAEAEVCVSMRACMGVLLARERMRCVYGVLFRSRTSLPACYVSALDALFLTALLTIRLLCPCFHSTRPRRSACMRRGPTLSGQSPPPPPL
jgi:hypothetical protein